MDFFDKTCIYTLVVFAVLAYHFVVARVGYVMGRAKFRELAGKHELGGWQINPVTGHRYWVFFNGLPGDLKKANETAEAWRKLSEEFKVTIHTLREANN